MDQPPAPSFDPALLDMENMTSDKWYSLIYTRIVQQEDIFVGDFKKKVVEIMNMCMNKPNATLESIQQDITNTINESQFESEHQKFIDGIVGGTYEYLCQFIIKNSMENIKRTQCALNCFSLTNNLNYGAIKSYCNDNMLLQGSSKLTQIQCLPESNNNTTDSDKAIQSYMLNSNSPNDENSVLNIKNTSVSKIETTSFNNYRSTLQINNLTVDCTNGLPLLDNIHTDDNVDSAHSSSIIDDDDEQTTEAIISLALKIQQTNFAYDDEFEGVDINVNNVPTTNEFQTTIEQNGDQNTDPLKLEEEYKIHNSLKLLETLVNIEHDKLEVQKSLKTENETEPIIQTNDKIRLKNSKKTNIRKKKSRKLQENIIKEEEDEEEWLPSTDKQNRCSKNKTKTNKRKSHTDKASKKNKKVKVKNTVNNLSTSNLSCSIKIENEEDTSLALKSPSYTKKPETIVSTVRNTKSLDTTSSVRTQLAYHNTKDCLPTEEFKGFSDNIESMLHNEKKNNLALAVNNLNALLIKSTTVASTSGSNEKDDIIKSKSTSGLSGSLMKTSDYKKLYEKDRKSLFSPDIVIIKHVPLKPSKDFLNDLHIKKEDQDKKPKSIIHKKESNNKTSDKKRKLSKPKVKSTNRSPKMTYNSKSKPNNALTSLEQKSSYKRSNNKCKRLKVTNSEGEAKTNSVNSANDESNTYISENKVSNNIDTLELQALDRTNFLQNNELGEGTSRHQQLNGVNVLENKESNKDTLELEAMPKWLRKKCELYNIKPVWIVIDPNSTY